MFNTPIFDVVLGLIFVFLLYSLLAASLKEGIATTLGLRARMLRRGIVWGMLTQTPDYTQNWAAVKSFYHGIGRFFRDVVNINNSRRRPKYPTLGSEFYRHPVIKNYGNSGIYPYPSYLPNGNFSMILIDTLKKDHLRKIDVLSAVTGRTKADLLEESDMNRMVLLLNQYRIYHNHLNGINEGVTCITEATCLIDGDTLTILELQFMDSRFDPAALKMGLETWFIDSMGRVSGWYKRQVQVILFFIGIVLAIALNVDVIDIATRLSKDDKLREQMVQAATAYSQSHKNLQGQTDPGFGQKVENKFDQADDKMQRDVSDLNSLLAVGYGKYGRDETNYIKDLKEKRWFPFFRKADPKLLQGNDTLVFDQLIHEYPLQMRLSYISGKFWWRKKMLGFFLLGLAVCLGAPFWFDLLGKFVNLRGTGDKVEDKAPRPPHPQPLTVNVNTNTGEEAVG